MYVYIYILPSVYTHTHTHTHIYIYVYADGVSMFEISMHYLYRHSLLIKMQGHNHSQLFSTYFLGLAAMSGVEL